MTPGRPAATRTQSRRASEPHLRPVPDEPRSVRARCHRSPAATTPVPWSPGTKRRRSVSTATECSDRSTAACAPAVTTSGFRPALQTPGAGQPRPRTDGAADPRPGHWRCGMHRHSVPSRLPAPQQPRVPQPPGHASPTTPHTAPSANRHHADACGAAPRHPPMVPTRLWRAPGEDQREPGLSRAPTAAPKVADAHAPSAGRTCEPTCQSARSTAVPTHTHLDGRRLANEAPRAGCSIRLQVNPPALGGFR
ncbi:hypothetical protein SXANM310S_02558 [Streptomyces xanthochromogenes]